MTHSPHELEQLKEAVKKLGTCCREFPDWHWPSFLLYRQFNSLVNTLYREQIARKHPSPIFWEAVTAVEHRWPGLRLEALLNGLVDRIIAHVPPGPVTRLLKIGSEPLTSPVQMKDIEVLARLLRTYDPSGPLPELTRSQFELLKPLTSHGFQRSYTTLGLRSPLEAKALLRENDSLITWAAFTDAHRLHLLWMRNYERDLMPFAQWIVGIQNDKLSEKLKGVLYGDIAPASGYQALHKKRRNRARAAKRRSKLSAE